MSELSPTPTTTHGILCHGIGKYDCSFDERVHELTMDGSVDGSGQTDAPTGWFAAVTLDIECEGHPDDDSTVNEAAGGEHTCDGSCSSDWEIYQHYGTPYLMINEDSNGFVYVAALATEEMQQLLLKTLEDQYTEWYDQDGEQL